MSTTGPWHIAHLYLEDPDDDATRCVDVLHPEGCAAEINTTEGLVWRCGITYERDHIGTEWIGDDTEPGWYWVRHWHETWSTPSYGAEHDTGVEVWGPITTPETTLLRMEAGPPDG